MPRTHRIAVIGSTGKGDYGHGLDTAFVGIDRARVVAVADDNPKGLEAAAKRIGAERSYADYREMLAKEKPDVVCVGPRWISNRVTMTEAVVGAGCHVYCEKPMAGSLADADAMVAAARKVGVKFALAHQWRASPPVQQAIRDVRAGKYGRLLRMRARAKDDARGGGEELLVHGTHLFDLMMAFAGPPRWVSGHAGVGPRDATKGDARQGTEPCGTIIGDSISAMYGFDGGIRGYFDSTAGIAVGKRDWDHLYGLFLECEQASLQLRQPGDVYVYPAPLVLPDLSKLEWSKLWVQEWHFTPEHEPRDHSRTFIREGNTYLANDLLDAIEQNREPLSSITTGQIVSEMVQGVYASHLAGGRRLVIPLVDRSNPLI
jgi:predicted dehydrogenase